MQIPFKISLLASAVVLAGCGGGGPGGSNTNTAVRSSVSYATPQNINHFVPMTDSGLDAPVMDVYAKDLNNDSADEVVIGGRKTQPSTADNWRNFNMQIYGWNTGSFTNETSSWFSGSDNVIVGSEPSIKFGDFNGDGNIDMLSAPSTDMTATLAKAVIFNNNGNNTFTRNDMSLPDHYSHDSWVGDLNGDGRDDIVLPNHVGDMSVSYGNADGSFTTYLGPGGGSAGISVADYLGNGTNTIIMTDAPVGSGTNDTRLYSFDHSSGTLRLQEIAQLPQSRFTHSKYDDIRANADWAPHGVRNFSMDFNADGLMDVVVVDTLTGSNIGRYSEMQFLQNNGAGNFIDVTDDVLVGYNNRRYASYNPTLMDVNNDGLMDIFLSATDFPSGGNEDNSYYDNTRVLVQTVEGKFVESYSDVFSDFATQIHNSTDNALDWYMPIQIIKGPNNTKYLFSTVVYNNNGNTEAKTYLARVGTAGTMSAQTVADAVKNIWPYLSDTSVNTVLASTSPLSLNGVEVVDLQSALQPVGDLSVNKVRIEGSINVPGLNTNALRHVTAKDSLDRNYNVDLTPLASTNTVGMDATVGVRPNSVFGFGDNNSYSIGADSSLLYNTDWRFGITVSNQPYNPWLSFDGMFGTISKSYTTEIDLSRTYDNGLWHRTGITQTKTEFTPGLVNNIDTLYSGYMVGGYTTDNLSLYGGVKPTLFAGKINMRLPTDVDNNGKLQYTDTVINVRNKMLGFIGVDYSFVLDLTKQVQWNVNAMIDSSGDKQGNLSAGLPW